MGSGWYFCRMSFLILPTLYHAWNYQGHVCTVGVLSDEKKTKEKYEELFAALKNMNAMLDPHEVTIDLEIAAIEALKSSFPNANIKGCSFHFAQAYWRKIQSVGLAREYQQDTELRNILKSFVALALIPQEDIYIGFQKLKETTAKMQNEKITEFVSYFEATWLGEKNLRGRRTGASFLPQIWCQFENAKEMRQTTTNAVEGWHRAIKGSLGYVHPTIFKFIDFLRREQSATENKLISLQAGKELPKNARYQKNALRIKNILEGYQKNRIELALNGLSNNFAFV